jgi:hypothetical protein
MANVTMDIAELDKLRDEIKDKSAKLDKLNEELINVKADKRVIKMLKPFSKADLNISVDAYSIYKAVQSGRNFGSLSGNSYESYVTIHPLIDLDKIVEFVNFDDVKQELRQKLETDYANEIAELKIAKKNCDVRIAEKQKEIDEIVRIAKRDLEEKDKVHQEIILGWEKKYKELEEGKKELSRIEELQEAVKSLTNMLIKEQSKTWWDKLRGK